MKKPQECISQGPISIAYTSKYFLVLSTSTIADFEDNQHSKISICLSRQVSAKTQGIGQTCGHRRGNPLVPDNIWGGGHHQDKEASEDWRENGFIHYTKTFVTPHSGSFHSRNTCTAMKSFPSTNVEGCIMYTHTCTWTSRAITISSHVWYSKVRDQGPPGNVLLGSLIAPRFRSHNSSSCFQPSSIKRFFSEPTVKLLWLKEAKHTFTVVSCWDELKFTSDLLQAGSSLLLLC